MLRSLKRLMGLALAVSLGYEAGFAATPKNKQDVDQLRTIAQEAYVYFYPLVTMDVTRRVTTNLPPGVKPGLGPINAFHHMRSFPDADFREVVRPNFDTLYSSAWVDVKKEPMIISVPDTKDRYYLLPVLDMWSDVVAVPGKRTSGTQSGHFALVTKDWQGRLPRGVERIEVSTPILWIIGRTQTNGPADYQAVHKVQDAYALTPLSRWGKAPAKPAPFTPDPSVDMKTSPLEQVDGLSGVEFFAYASELLKLHPPHVTDWSMVQRIKRLGIEPGKDFQVDTLDPAMIEILDQGVKDGLAVMKEKAPTLARVVNGWQMNTDTMGVYGNYYLKRAIVAQVGLGANQVDDAIYPLAITDENQEPLLGEKNYVLHFNKEELPPVGAFWSVTMYDAQGFQVKNPLNRFAIGDRDNLRFNPDGSLDIYIQATSPGREKESNWLPSPPSGPLGVTMRLYAPKPEALDGRWAPPAIQVAKDTKTTMN